MKVPLEAHKKEKEHSTSLSGGREERWLLHGYPVHERSFLQSLHISEHFMGSPNARVDSGLPGDGT